MADGATGRSDGGAERSRAGGIIDLVFLPFEKLGEMIGKAVGAVFSDGTLAAAGRQGVDELGAALKAFPDTIQASELGTLWSPTPGEIAADREHDKHAARPGGQTYLSPSEIVNQNRHLPSKDRDHGHETGHDAGFSM